MIVNETVLLESNIHSVLNKQDQETNLNDNYYIGRFINPTNDQNLFASNNQILSINQNYVPIGAQTISDGFGTNAYQNYFNNFYNQQQFFFIKLIKTVIKIHRNVMIY